MGPAGVGGAYVPVALVALAVSAQRAAERVSRFARFLSSGVTDAFWCAATSATDAIGFDGVCAPFIPVKWEEHSVNAALSAAAVLLLLATWTAAAPAVAAPVPARLPASHARRWAQVALHGGWLAVHAALDRAYEHYWVPQWLCTWSWWSTAVYAAARLVEAVRHAGSFGRDPGLRVVYGAAAGFLLCTNFVFFCVPQEDLANVLLHAISPAYLVLAALLDERRRLAKQARRALLATAAAAGAVPPLLIALYGHVFDYRDLYAPFVGGAPVTPWYTSLVPILSGSFACLFCLWLYGGTRGARRWGELALLVSAAAIVPAALLVADPDRHYHVRNCPPAPVPIARYDDATAHWAVDRGAWDRLAGELRTPVYVHAIVTAADNASEAAAVDAEIAHLERQLLRQDLRAPCVGHLRLPRDNDGGGHTLWAWAVALRKTAPELHTRFISDDWRVQQRGTLLILLARGVVAASAPAALAATAYAPSVTLHVPRAPDDAPSVAAVLEQLERAVAAWDYRRIQRGLPLTIEGERAVIVSASGQAASPRLGRIALVATQHARVNHVARTTGEPSFHAPDVLLTVLEQHTDLAQRWQALGAPVGLYALGLDYLEVEPAKNAPVFDARDSNSPWAKQHFAGGLAPAQARQDGRWLTPDEVLDDLASFLSAMQM